MTNRKPAPASSDPGLDRLRAIVERLRAPDGCPWDRKQTLASMRMYLLEEAYEVLDAVDRGDDDAHAEELGDLLFHVVFQASLQQERGAFALEQVIAGICDKLKRRHPHVFGQLSPPLDEEEVPARWEAAKRSEGKGTVHDVPRALPALMRAQEVGKRASRLGFDWPSMAGPLDKLREEVAEFEAAVDSGDQAGMDSELGDILFAAVNVARHAKVNAEQALNGTVGRFLDRFRYVEGQLAARGKTTDTATLAEMDLLWEEAKRR